MCGMVYMSQLRTLSNWFGSMSSPEIVPPLLAVSSSRAIACVVLPLWKRLSLWKLALQRTAFFDEKAIRAMIKLILGTPEFHLTSLSMNSHVIPEPEVNTVPLEHPYKAVVFLMFLGGMESYNLLVPKDACSSNDMNLYDQ